MRTGTVRVLAVAALLAFFAIVWFVLAGLGAFSAFLLPSPATVGGALGRILGQGGTYSAVLTTVWEVLAAFALAVVGGLAVGIPVGLRRATRDAYEPVIANLAAVPIVVIYPVFLAILGVGSPSKVVFGAVTAFFAVALATTIGVGSIDPTLLRASRSMGARGARLFRVVIFPAALPQIRNGMKLGIVLATLAVVAGEFIGGSGGLGYLLASAGQAFKTPDVYAYMIVTLALAVVLQIVLTGALRLSERGGTR